MFGANTNKKAMEMEQVVQMLMILAAAAILLVVVDQIANDGKALSSMMPGIANSLFGKEPPKENSLAKLNKDIKHYYDLNAGKIDDPTKEPSEVEWEFTKKESLGDLQVYHVQPEDGAFKVVTKKLGTNPDCIKPTITKENNEYIITLTKC